MEKVDSESYWKDGLKLSNRLGDVIVNPSHIEISKNKIENLENCVLIKSDKRSFGKGNCPYYYQTKSNGELSNLRATCVNPDSPNILFLHFFGFLYEEAFDKNAFYKPNKWRFKGGLPFDKNRNSIGIKSIANSINKIRKMANNMVAINWSYTEIKVNYKWPKGSYASDNIHAKMIESSDRWKDLTKDSNARHTMILLRSNGVPHAAGNKAFIIGASSMTMLHEIGHTLGLGHAAIPGNSYGDNTSLMSNRNSSNYNVPQRYFIGWTKPEECVFIEKNTTYELQNSNNYNTKGTLMLVFPGWDCLSYVNGRFCVYRLFGIRRCVRLQRFTLNLNHIKIIKGFKIKCISKNTNQCKLEIF